MDKQAKRRIGKSILAVGILLAMLVMATGSASANGVCVWGNIDNGEFYQCGQTVTQSCTLNATMICDTRYGLIVGASDITINGYNSTQDQYFAIDGQSPGTCAPVRAGIYNAPGEAGGYDNVVIKNLEIKNFCYGIRIRGSTENVPVENNTIDNCKVHDNGNASSNQKTQGIDLYCANNSKITNSTVYNNTGYVEGSCEDGGMGIRLYGCGCVGANTFYGNHTIKNNTIYNNTLSGIFSKNGCKYCNVSYNKIYDNGKTSPGNGNMSGGIRLECLLTNNWTVEYNTITNNTGPGIYVRGDYNNISHNDVTNNNNASNCDVEGTDVDAGDGIYLIGDYNNITYNRFCNNEFYDIYNDSDSTGNTFYYNICDKSHPDGLCEYQCVHAYGHYNNSKPPATCDVPNTAISRSRVRVKDGVYEQSNTGAATGYYATQRFNFTVREDSSKIDKIKVIWYGMGWHDNGSAYNGSQLYICNSSKASDPYKELKSTSSGNWGYLTGEVNTTDGISNFISAHNVTILVEQKCKDAGRNQDSHIRTDLAKIVIYFKDP